MPLMFIGMEYLRTNNLPLAKHFLRGATRLCDSDPLVANELGVVELRQGLLEDAATTFRTVLDLLDRLPERAPLRSACAAAVFNLAQTYLRRADIRIAATPRPSRVIPWRRDPRNIRAAPRGGVATRPRRRRDRGRIRPRNFSTGARLRYRKMRRFRDAATYFRVALALRPDDAAARGALGVALHALGGADIHRAVECYHTALAMRPDDTFCSEMLSRALRDVADLPEDLSSDPRGSIELLAERRLGDADDDDDFHDAMDA